ncbi:MAG: hypothetical protein ACJ79H_10700 [Myxococcales bacterium]
MATIHALQRTIPTTPAAEEPPVPEHWMIDKGDLRGWAADSYRRVEQRCVEWIAAHGVALLRISLGIVLSWFGALKFVPLASPAAGLAAATVGKLTFGLLDPRAALLLLAVWETAVGVALVAGIYLRAAIWLLLLQMAGTLTPLALFPSLTFTSFPFAPTMEGQYILKNLVLISAAIVVGSSMRGPALGTLSRGRPRCACR